jgi:translation elongation factor P/translation initiation factor 5A
MPQSTQITPGMILSLKGSLYRVDSSVKVTTKGLPLIKTKLKKIKKSATSKGEIYVAQDQIKKDKKELQKDLKVWLKLTKKVFQLKPAAA